MKDPGKTSAETQRAFDAITAALADRGAQAGKMFGMASLKAKGKAFAGVYGDAMVFKLAGDTHAGALKLKGAELFDPSGMGRAMKEWVVVPRAHSARWTALATAACEYVTGG